jgi:hypothetical protein
VVVLSFSDEISLGFYSGNTWGNKMGNQERIGLEGMIKRNWHDGAISPELGSFCQKSHLIADLIQLS